MKAQANEKELRRDPDPQLQNHLAKAAASGRGGRVHIEYYTDPLCCWSWAFEKPWRQLLSKYGDQVSYCYVMCGMIPDWNSYNDAMNAVSRPLQMGPVWMHASEVTRVKMRYDIWHLDPPSSSYPACIAVKTAGLQSDKAAEQYLYEMRRSMMEEALNISRAEALLSIAERVPGIDAERFRRDWHAGLGKQPFRDDLKKARFHGIGRFPSLTFLNDADVGSMIVGYRPFEVLEQALSTSLENRS